MEVYIQKTPENYTRITDDISVTIHCKDNEKVKAEILKGFIEALPKEWEDYCKKLSK